MHLTTYRIMYFVELKCVFLLQFESHLYSIKCSHFNSIVFHIYNGKLSTVGFTFIVYVPLNSMCSTFTVHPVFNFWKNASSFNSKIWKDPLLQYNGPPPQHVPLYSIRLFHFFKQASTDLFGKKKTEHLLCFKILNVFHFYKINVNCFTFTVKLYHFYCMWKMYSTFIIFTANCVLLLQHYVVPFYSNHPLTCLTGWKL